MRKVLLAAFLVVVCSNLAIAQVRSFGKWIAGPQTAAQGWYAATTNDSGHVFGQYCFSPSGDCMYILALRNVCKDGDRYPVLVNSDKGSESLQVYCDGPLDDGRYRYVFTDFSRIHKIVLEAYRAGLAFPLQGDEFIVVRFSLVGSNEAIDALDAAMRRIVPTPTPTPARQGTRDQRL